MLLPGFPPSSPGNGLQEAFTHFGVNSRAVGTSRGGCGGSVCLQGDRSTRILQEWLGEERAHHHHPSTQETEHLETSFSPKVLKLLESYWHTWVAKLVSTTTCKGGNPQPNGEGKLISDLLAILASPVPCVAAFPSFMAWSLGRSLQCGVQD